MKKILFLISCLAAGWLGAQAQAPRTISDFEGEEGILLVRKLNLKLWTIR